MWIKICGVTRVEDVKTVVRSGANAIGFNFFPGSLRYVPARRATTLTEAAFSAGKGQPPIDLVGVFVNSDAKLIREIADESGINVIQIHGDESANQVAEIQQACPDTPLIRAFRVDPLAPERTLEAIDQLMELVPLTAILLDAFVPGAFGGTGKTIDHRVLSDYSRQSRPPLILAGGLTPENVLDVASNPAIAGIDTASGVESSAGIKDANRVHQFVSLIRSLNSGEGETKRIRDLRNR